MQALKICHIAKVGKTRIFSMAVHPTTVKNVCCVGDKRGNIGIWDTVSPFNYTIMFRVVYIMYLTSLTSLVLTNAA